MSDNKKLGVYWGNDAFYFVEAKNNIPTKVFDAPHQLSHDFASTGKKESTEGIRLTEIIQSALTQQEISEKNINLSLPSKNIIFRSFIIPWMQSSEIKGVVEFEASKYIPFKMEDLSHTHHVVTFTENRKKKMMVLFTAIRRDIIENYCNVFIHSGLHINCVEPSSLSLMRTLVLKKQLKKNQTTAVLEADEIAGKIVIIDNEIPHFTRDFQLALPNEQSSDNFDARQARFFNEIRISLDYYGRQHSQKKVDNILFITNKEDNALAGGLSEFLNIPTTNVNMGPLLNAEKVSGTGFVNAFGVCLRDAVATDVNFDLSWKKGKPEEETEAVSKPNYVNVLITAVVCLGLIFLSSKATARRISNYEKKIESTKGSLGPYESATQASIKEQGDALSKKLKSYEDIPLSSDIGYYLSIVPYLLPDGIWLRDFNIRRSGDGKNINIELSGYAYSKDTNYDISLVNILIDNLKSSKEFSKNFKDIDLTAINREVINDQPVRYFSIRCK